MTDDEKTNPSASEEVAYVALKGFYNSALREIDRLTDEVERLRNAKTTELKRQEIACSKCRTRFVLFSAANQSASIIYLAKASGWLGVEDLNERGAIVCEVCRHCQE